MYLQELTALGELVSKLLQNNDKRLVKELLLRHLDQ
jgi:hypothetical protein